METNEPRAQVGSLNRRALSVVLGGALAAVAAVALLIVLRPAKSAQRLLADAAETVAANPAGALVKAEASIAAAGGHYPEAQLVKCRALVGVGRAQEAADYFRQIADGLTDRADAWRPQLRAYVEAQHAVGQESDVLDHCERYARLAPDDPVPWLIVARVSFANEQPVRALDAYREAIKRNPPTPERLHAGFQIADLLLRLGDVKSARREVDELTREHPASEEAHILRAKILHQEGNTAESLQLLDETVANSPAPANVLVLRGSIRFDQGQFQLAVDDLTKVVAVRPFDRKARYKLGQAFQGLKQTELAKQQLEIAHHLTSLQARAVQLQTQIYFDPKNRRLQLELADVCEQRGDREKAEHWRRSAQ